MFAFQPLKSKEWESGDLSKMEDSMRLIRMLDLPYIRVATLGELFLYLTKFSLNSAE